MPAHANVVNLVGSAVEHVMTNTGLRNSGWNGEIREKLERDFGWNFIGNGYFSAVMENPFDASSVIKVAFGVGTGPTGDGYMDYVAWCMRQQRTSTWMPKFYDARIFNKCAVVVMERLNKWAGYDHSDIIRTLRGMGELNAVETDLGMFNDIHDQNVMERDGALVITDPYSSRNARDSARVNNYVDKVGRVRMYATKVVNTVPLDMYKLQSADRGRPSRMVNFNAGILACNCVICQPRKRDPAFTDMKLRGRSWARVEFRKTAFMQMQRKEVQIATPVAPISTVARVRKEKEDRMLRLRAKHDHPAHIKGVRRALL